MIDFDITKLGKQIGMGATAGVYAYGNDQIIKIFKSEYPLSHVEEEFQNCSVVEKTGLPVPKNYGICQISGSGNEELDNHFAYIQERIRGISIMKKIMENPSFEACSGMIRDMIELQVRMHQIEADGLGLRNQKEILHLFISWAPLLTEDEKSKLYSILDSLPEGNRICHGDYHMDNIFLTNKGLVCFDWCDVTSGNPMADLARSLLIFKCTGLPDSIPKEVVELTIKMQSVCWDFYIKTYEQLSGSIENLEEWLAVVAASRLFCDIDANKQCMLKIVRDYLAHGDGASVLF